MPRYGRSVTLTRYVPKSVTVAGFCRSAAGSQVGGFHNSSHTRLCAKRRVRVIGAERKVASVAPVRNKYRICSVCRYEGQPPKGMRGAVATVVSAGQKA